MIDQVKNIFQFSFKNWGNRQLLHLEYLWKSSYFWYLKLNDIFIQVEMVPSRYATIVPKYVKLKQALSPLLFLTFLTECLALISQALSIVYTQGSICIPKI